MADDEPVDEAQAGPEKDDVDDERRCQVRAQSVRRNLCEMHNRKFYGETCVRCTTVNFVHNRKFCELSQCGETCIVRNNLHCGWNGKMRVEYQVCATIQKVCAKHRVCLEL